MEAHYFANDCFMQPNQLLRGADRLKGITGIIVRAATTCCVRRDLARAWRAVARGRDRFVGGRGHRCTTRRPRRRDEGDRRQASRTGK